MQDKTVHSTYIKGKRAECQAALYLRKLGYAILCANYHTRHGEIDLVAREGACLVFVEVKTRNTQRFGSPEEALTVQKQKRLFKTARYYLRQNPWHGHIRFDVVTFYRGKISHYRNALEA